MPPLFHTVPMYIAIRKGYTFAAILYEHHIAFWAWIPGLPCGARITISHQALKLVLRLFDDRKLKIPPISSLPSIPSSNYSAIHERRPDLISPIDNKFRSATLPPVENAILVLKCISARIGTTNDIPNRIFSEFFKNRLISVFVFSNHVRCTLTKPFTPIHDFDTPILISKEPGAICDAYLPDIEHDTKYAIYLGSDSDCVSIAYFYEDTEILPSALERFNAYLSVMKRLISAGHKYEFPIDRLKSAHMEESSASDQHLDSSLTISPSPPGPFKSSQGSNQSQQK